MSAPATPGAGILVPRILISRHPTWQVVPVETLSFIVTRGWWLFDSQTAAVRLWPKRPARVPGSCRHPRLGSPVPTAGRLYRIQAGYTNARGVISRWSCDPEHGPLNGRIDRRPGNIALIGIVRAYCRRGPYDRPPIAGRQRICGATATVSRHLRRHSRPILGSLSRRRLRKPRLTSRSPGKLAGKHRGLVAPRLCHRGERRAPAGAWIACRKRTGLREEAAGIGSRRAWARGITLPGSKPWRIRRPLISQLPGWSLLGLAVPRIHRRPRNGLRAEARHLGDPIERTCLGRGKPGSRPPLLSEGQGLTLRKQDAAKHYHSTKCNKLPSKPHAISLALLYDF